MTDIKRRAKSAFHRMSLTLSRTAFADVGAAKAQLRQLFGTDSLSELTDPQCAELIKLTGLGKFACADFRKTPINNTGDETDDEPELTVADLVPSTDGSRRADISSPEAVARIYKQWNSRPKVRAPRMGGKAKLTDKRFSK